MEKRDGSVGSRIWDRDGKYWKVGLEIRGRHFLTPLSLLLSINSHYLLESLEALLELTHP